MESFGGTISLVCMVIPFVLCYQRFVWSLTHAIVRELDAMVLLMPLNNWCNTRIIVPELRLILAFCFILFCETVWECWYELMMPRLSMLYSLFRRGINLFSPQKK